MVNGIKVNIKKEDKCKQIIYIEISQENVIKEIENTISEVQKIASIPGFRAGKVPRNLIMQYYKDRVESEALDKLIQDSYKLTITRENIVPVREAKIKDIKFEKDKPLSFNLEVEVKPDIKFRYYKGIEVDEERVRVDSKDVDDVLKNIRERIAEYITIEDRCVQKGNLVTVDVSGFKDGKLIDKFNGKDLRFEVGVNTVMKDIEESVIDMNINTEKEILVKLPKEYPDKELAEKEIQLKIKLKSIQEKKLPVLDDEFAKDVGECETLAILRKKIEEDIRKNREAEKKNLIEQKILKELISITPMDLPDFLVETEFEHLMDDIKERMERENTSFEALKTTEDEVRDRYRQVAIEKVKGYLIIEELANLEKINIAENDIENEIANIKTKLIRKDQKIDEYLSSDSGRNRIKYDIMVQKTLDFLYNNAKINWK